MSGNLLSLGYGYTGRRFLARISRTGWRVAATARTAEKAAAMADDPVTPVAWRAGAIADDAFDDADAILVTTPPGPAGCPALAAAKDRLASGLPRLRWLGYLSSNGVYGDHDGAWVNETSQTRPGTPRGKRRLAAEDEWRTLARDHRLPLIIFRLPGIYGPGRSALDSVRNGRARRIIKPGQVFNRMHVDDIAAALAKSLHDPAAGELFNLADDEPSPPQDVISFACHLLGEAPPPEICLANAALSEMGRSFYAENKRVSNAHMKSALKLDLSFPNYREGLRAIHAASP